MMALLPTLSLVTGGASWLPVGAEVTGDDSAESYVVQAGDTLYGIARRHGRDVATLVALNALSDPSHILPGQVLLLTRTVAGQGGSVQYTVAAGDTLYGIAHRFSVSVQALLEANRLANPNLLQIGQVLKIPSGTSVPVPAPAPVPVPAAVGPAGSGAALPTSLFGRAATDPARLVLVASFDRWAEHSRIDRNLLKGLAYVESSWRVDAVSGAGAVGVGQLMPATSVWITSSLIGDPTLDPQRADDNIRMSARYLRYLIDELDVEDMAIGAYYQGIGSVQRDGMGAGTVQYIARVRAAQSAFLVE